MEEFGVRNPAAGIADIGLGKAASVRYNFLEAALYEEAIRRGEAELTADGALRALTGQHTGRSAKDKFTVEDVTTQGNIWFNGGTGSNDCPRKKATLIYLSKQWVLRNQCVGSSPCPGGP